MNEKLMKKYATLLVKTGVNIQMGQTLIIESPIDCHDFARILTQTAFECGAGDVICHYVDPVYQKIRANYLPEEKISYVEKWQKESLDRYLKDGACSLLLTSPDPYLMQDMSESKAGALQTFTNDLRNVIRSRIATDHVQWCIAAVPNQKWAEAIMPNEDPSCVLDKFWDLLFKLVYVDENSDPVENWKEKAKRRALITKQLDDFDLDHIHMTAGNGTDITFGFHPDYSWGSRRQEDPKAIKYAPNIPTEEVCTSPDKYRTNGVVYSTKPLMIGGKIVNDFKVEFKDGKVVNVEAKEGEELLKGIIATDEGSCYLGEVAFVPYHSPISESGLIYFNTLIDENASCHIALGKGFPGTVDVTSQDPKDWEAKHLNFSKIHIDFMIGAKDTKIIGYKKDGSEVMIFENGDFAF